MGWPMLVTVITDGGVSIVRLTGEIDLAAAGLMDEACFAGNDLDVVFDLTGATFMDCAGYAILRTAQRDIENIGGSVTIRSATGQPARLLHLIAQLEAGRHNICDVV